MELIKLSIDLGLLVIKKLKELDNTYEPRKTSTGIYSLEFTEEELLKITDLEIENPKPGCLDGLEHFKNLQRLVINNKNYSAYKKDSASISDKDIKTISKLKSLKYLSIKGQSKITWIDVTNLENLEELEIIRNTKIDTMVGLEKLKKLKVLSIYGNKELYDIENLENIVSSIDFNLLELDLMHLNEMSNLLNKMLGKNTCYFIETVSDGKDLRYNIGSALVFHKKCLQIAKEIASKGRTKKELIILTEKYIAENIFYDNDALKLEDRIHIEGGNKRGLKNGTQSAYNGIMYGSCVCEGYTRSMQYILKLLGIKTKNVYCIGGKDKIKVRTNYHNIVELPDDGYHSIIRLDLDDGIYYCDPCWDSTHWHNGDNSLPYCLKTRKDISKNHTLSFEEDNISKDSVFSSVDPYSIQSIIERDEIGKKI